MTLEVEDARRNYGEPRVVCYGLLEGRMVVVGCTPRGADRHVKKLAVRRSLKSDVARVDADNVNPAEYEEPSELTDDMFVHANVNKGGRPFSPNPRTLISLRLPADVIERGTATGPGWHTHMAERLTRVR